ncbi:MAG: DUF4873 domain-containing protein, partial [Actinocatenispora sp.]
TDTRPAGTTEAGPDEDGYRGPVTLSVDGRSVRVDAELRGEFEPISGRYRWYGRLAADDGVAGLAADRARDVTVRTPHGEARTTLTDADPWGRYRVSGTGPPPFPVGTAPSGSD